MIFLMKKQSTAGHMHKYFPDSIEVHLKTKTRALTKITVIILSMHLRANCICLAKGDWSIYNRQKINS